jgi:hypothetical protein
VSGAAQTGDLRFEGGAFAAEDKLLRRQHALDCDSNFAANGSELRSEVKLWHGL